MLRPTKCGAVLVLGGEVSSRRERVQVCFEARGDSTEVMVVHERITDASVREPHAQGWLTCVDGLAAQFS